jgi:hypothetical protein
VLGCRIGSRGEVPAERKPIIRDNDNNKDGTAATTIITTIQMATATPALDNGDCNPDTKITKQETAQKH